MFGTRDNGGEERNSKAQKDTAEPQTSGRDIHPNLQNAPELIFICSRRHTVVCSAGWCLFHLRAHIFESEKSISSR